MAIGGGFKAVKSVARYSLKIGPLKLLETLKSKNACKACSFGTGGQNGGIRNESNKGIEFCNKNIQAHLSDIREGIANTLFFEKSIHELSQLSGKKLEDLGRLATPLYKKQNQQHYSPISYEDALDKIVTRLKQTEPDRSFFYASGRSSNEAAFTLQLLARLYGTNNINNCSYYCHQASGVGLHSTIGTGTATIQYDDLNKADCIFVFGANPASNHPRYLKTLIQCRRRGGKVIIVNPAKEPGLVKFASPSDLLSMLKGGEEIASTYIQPHLGGDLALIQGIAKWIIENNHHDQEFIQNCTDGFSEYTTNITGLPWQEIISNSGVSFEEIEKIAQLYCQAKHVVFSWSMGLTHHLHGVSNIEAIASLALLRAMIGKPGAGLLPLRGHSNIQGMGSMGFTPQLKTAIEKKLEAKLGSMLPRSLGKDTMSCMLASAKNEMDLAFILGGNLLAANPDTDFATKALGNIPFKCFLSSTLNQSHLNGVNDEVVILPIKVRDEETQSTTQESMFNFVRMSDGGIKRFPQLRSEVDLIREIGEKLISKSIFDFSIFSSHHSIRQFVGDIVPGFRQLSNIDASKEEFHIEGRTLHQPVFPTTNGKAVFKFNSLPNRENTEFRLTTVRSEGQFNSIIYDEQDVYRGQTSRDVLMMNPEDMIEFGFRKNQKVNLRSKTGQLNNLTIKPFDIRRGNVMTYYPEANVLTSREVDSKSQTPAFKALAVDIQIA
ncbi:FdhF/YdeP family oxidoreductase [Aurantivibrio infirmus]